MPVYCVWCHPMGCNSILHFFKREEVRRTGLFIVVFFLHVWMHCDQMLQVIPQTVPPTVHPKLRGQQSPLPARERKIWPKFKNEKTDVERSKFLFQDRKNINYRCNSKSLYLDLNSTCLNQRSGPFHFVALLPTLLLLCSPFDPPTSSGYLGSDCLSLVSVH